MIVTTANFVGQNAIAQIEQANVAAEVQIYIDKYEPEYLNMVLGFDLQGYFKEQLALDPPTPDYVQLRDGGFFEKNGRRYPFAGIKSAMVNYIYYQYLKQQVSFTTGSGEQNIATPVSSIDKQVRAWNEMVDVSLTVYDFAIYKEMPYTDQLRPNCNLRYINPLGI